MKLPRSRGEEPQLNLTSLIDVVFLLLIFFMVTTTFVPDAGLRLRLPEAQAEARPAAERQPLEVMIDAGDNIYIGGETVSRAPAPLRARLSAIAGSDFERGVRIRADGRASHQAVVAVMDATAALGFSRVDIVTRPLESGR